MNKPWEVAAKKFVDSCDFKDDIEAVFLTGSYAFGNADDFSDIDLYIVLNDSVDWRQRGNRRIDGFLVEYFANPSRQIKKYIDTNYENVRTTEINMILGGIVIFNKNSAADELIDYCRQKIATDFPEMTEFSIKTGLYFLWCNYDELRRAYAYQTPDFKMQFYRFVQHAFELYSRYICSPVPSYYKLYNWLTNDEYRRKYGLATHKDPDFLELVKSSFENKNTEAMLDLSKTVYAYITDKMGGFDIDNFEFRSQSE